MFSDNSSKRSTEFLGNNEPKTHARQQASPAKKYVFTKYNCDSSIEPDFQDSLRLICEEFQYSHEICPSTNRPHLQGQLILKKKMRITQIVKFKHLNMHLQVQRGTQFENDVYIIKNTDNHIKWIAPKDNLRTKLKEEFSKLNNNELISLRSQLLTKHFSTDKLSLDIALNILSQLATAYNKSDEEFNLREFLLSDCIFYMIELESKKRVVNIINRYV